MHIAQWTEVKSLLKIFHLPVGSLAYTILFALACNFIEVTKAYPMRIILGFEIFEKIPIAYLFCSFRVLIETCWLRYFNIGGLVLIKTNGTNVPPSVWDIWILVDWFNNFARSPLLPMLSTENSNQNEGLFWYYLTCDYYSWFQ